MTAMQTSLTNDVHTYLAPEVCLKAGPAKASRKARVLTNLMARPGTVGELVATASALCALGERFYAEVDTTPDAREAGLQQAWICSDPCMVQLAAASDECFHPQAGDDSRRTYITSDPDPYSKARYLWTFIRAGHAWLVLVEWRLEWGC